MLKSLLGNAMDAAKRFAPAALTPEKRFAKALISAAAIMTMADGKAEKSEIEEASGLIFSHGSIKQFLSPKEAEEIYTLQIEKLQGASEKGISSFALAINALIADIADTVKDNTWRAEIVDTARRIGQSNGSGALGNSEHEALNKIQTALA